MHNKRLIPVRSFQDGFLGADVLQMVEGPLTVLCPVPLSVFTGEIVERACDVGEVRDKGSVKVTEAQETSHVLDTRGGWPLCDSLYLDRIHAHLSVAYDHAEVFDLPLMEVALLRLEE